MKTYCKVVAVAVLALIGLALHLDRTRLTRN